MKATLCKNKNGYGNIYSLVLTVIFLWWVKAMKERWRQEDQSHKVWRNEHDLWNKDYVLGTHYCVAICLRLHVEKYEMLGLVFVVLAITSTWLTKVIAEIWKTVTLTVRWSDWMYKVHPNYPNQFIWSKTNIHGSQRIHSNHFPSHFL